MTIHCKNDHKKVEAHKIILSASSNYFKEQLKRNNDELTIECSGQEMIQILEFIYIGQVVLENENLGSFLALCTKLQIKGLPENYEFKPEVEKTEKGLIDKLEFPNEFDHALADLIASEMVLEDHGKNKKENNFVDFPPELLIKILSYVSTADLLNNVALTSKHFNRLTKDPSCHLSVSFFFNVKKSSAAQFLTWASHIKELSILSFKEALIEVRNDIRQVHYCDEILAAVSMHSNLRIVKIDGMKARVSGLNSLVRTNFFGKLSKLVLLIEEKPNNFEATALALCSTGNLRHVELKGMQKVNPQVIKNMAVSCSKLENLTTDCPLTNPDAVEILVAHKSTLKGLGIHNIEITNELIEAQRECKNLEGFLINYYPLFTQLKNFQNLTWLFLDCQINFSSDLLERALTPGALPLLGFLSIRTEKDEAKIFSTIPKAFPYLKKITIISHNQESQIEVFRKLISNTKLQCFIFCLVSNQGYTISDMFNGIDGSLLMLKFIKVYHGTYPRREARKLLNQIPTLEGIEFKNCLYVRSSDSIGKVKAMENCNNGIYDQIHILESD